MNTEQFKGHLSKNSFFYAMGIVIPVTLFGLTHCFTPTILNFHYECRTKTGADSQTWCKKYKVYDDGTSEFVSKKLGACPAPHPECP